MNIAKITPLIITYNEEANISRTLDRLKWAKEIIILDSFSIDQTLLIAQSYYNVRVIQRSFDSFANQCNFGLKKVTTEWVLSLDADYVCSSELIEAIKELPEESKVTGYSVPFIYQIFGRSLRSTLYPRRIVLFEKNTAKYSQDGHAHRLKIDGNIQTLSASIYHDDRKPLSSWLEAQSRYANQECNKLIVADPSKISFTDRVRQKIWIAPLLTFFYCLFYKRLILDGWIGIYYTFQRTYAEILLSLALLEKKMSQSFKKKQNIKFRN